MTYLQRVGKFFASRWNVWLPPVLLTLIVYIVMVFFVRGENMSTFVYKLF